MIVWGSKGGKQGGMIEWGGKGGKLAWGGKGGRIVNCYVNIITFILWVDRWPNLPQGFTCSLHELSWTFIRQSVNVSFISVVRFT